MKVETMAMFAKTQLYFRKQMGEFLKYAHLATEKQDKQTKNLEINKIDESKVPIGKSMALSFLLGFEERNDDNEDYYDDPQAHELFPVTRPFNRVDTRGSLLLLRRKSRDLRTFKSCKWQLIEIQLS
ncbi:hypothetical protein PsorP6_016410 [Peronosclerospora sorghi]|uniref:Uncharacterized protein n=1 Tax=Peronosclerospora sorghi TaxID=230839 RepID=A0ACC0VSC7_9STRA|nr:hypothetical protein PsorP6_016410 [Peronosclerospora sorghi]